MKPVCNEVCVNCVFVAVMRSVRDATVMDEACQLSVRTNRRADARQSPKAKVKMSVPMSTTCVLVVRTVGKCTTHV